MTTIIKKFKSEIRLENERIKSRILIPGLIYAMIAILFALMFTLMEI